ncbi:HEPN family nuclease [Labilibacter marinus]|uniref:HEPN family nuclease n=1 Tax=Labilibacter marinus TaxID=1477105 RepID=UPI00094FA76B|nr:HEPN family nuclease [Labilibacter marinus]
MSNSREEIPVWTWYNGQFLFQFDEQLKTNPDMTISEFFSKFQTNQGIQDLNFYHTKNQGTVILLMYGLMVIPKEIWEMTSTKFAFTTRKNFTINLPANTEDIDTLKFLRLLRNSLAHANFSIDVSNARLTFWNNNKNGNKNFEVEISYSDLGEFTAEVGKYYVNEVKND